MQRTLALSRGSAHSSEGDLSSPSVVINLCLVVARVWTYLILRPNGQSALDVRRATFCALDR